MDENKYCQLINNLIPRYVNNQCTEAEAQLLEEHCSGCQTCRTKLQQAIEQGGGHSVKGISSGQGQRDSEAVKKRRFITIAIAAAVVVAVIIGAVSGKDILQKKVSGHGGASKTNESEQADSRPEHLSVDPAPEI